MQTFTGWQYLLIECANAFGLDKLLFEERIDWVTMNLGNLEQMADRADTKPLFMKAVMAIRKAQAGEPTGHLVALDACCSGLQVMSALTGCVAGATATGLVDPNVRADAYTIGVQFMNEDLKHSGLSVEIARGDAKQAIMTHYYGSKAEPKHLFGEDTPELNAFYQAMYKLSPGSEELLQDLLASWQAYTLEHRWKLPDGFDARVKVMTKKEARVEVDELNHATFTYEFYENEGTKTGLSNVANVVHSVDAYVLRSIHRRCNYDVDVIGKAWTAILKEHGDRRDHGVKAEPLDPEGMLAYYVAQFERSGMADIAIAPYIDSHTVHQLSSAHMDKLESIMNSMSMHAPFPVVTIHDEFKCHANNMNHLRQHYINIFAELAESNLLSDILSQIHGKKGTFTKLTNDLGSKIRGSNYALS